MRQKKILLTALAFALATAAILAQAAMISIPQINPISMGWPMRYVPIQFPQHRPLSKSISSDLERFKLVDAQV